MGKYFGREPRYSREEIERQAQEAIDARVSLGRPPAEDWAPLNDRLAELDRAMAARMPLPGMTDAQALRLHEVRVAMPAPALVEPVTDERRPVPAR